MHNNSDHNNDKVGNFLLLFIFKIFKFLCFQKQKKNIISRRPSNNRIQLACMGYKNVLNKKTKYSLHFLFIWSLSFKKKKHAAINCIYLDENFNDLE